MKDNELAKLLLLGYHKCQNCNYIGPLIETQKNKRVIERPEPYYQEILNETKLVWLCDDCYYTKCLEI